MCVSVRVVGSIVAFVFLVDMELYGRFVWYKESCVKSFLVGRCSGLRRAGVPLSSFL